MDKKIITQVCVLVCKGQSNDDHVGMARGTACQAIRPGSGFKTGDFVKKKSLGGAAVERLQGCWLEEL